MKLKVLSDYRERAVFHEKGSEITVDDREGERLLADSPGSFQRIGGSSHTDPAGGAKVPAEKTAPKAAESAQGSSPRHTELLAMTMNDLKALGQSLGVNTRIFGLGKDKLIQMILDAEAGGAKALTGPDRDKMIGAAPEQK